MNPGVRHRPSNDRSFRGDAAHQDLFSVPLCLCGALLCGLIGLRASQPEFPGMLHEHPLIQYASRQPSDRVARLSRLGSEGLVALAREPRTGYLRAVLHELGLSPASQILVFSKTGVQREFTGPRTPRAIFFGESVFVAYVPGAP